MWLRSQCFKLYKWSWQSCLLRRWYHWSSYFILLLSPELMGVRGFFFLVFFIIVPSNKVRSFQLMPKKLLILQTLIIKWVLQFEQHYEENGSVKNKQANIHVCTHIYTQCPQGHLLLIHLTKFHYDFLFLCKW